ncbi:unnamed protein product [Chrysodeixis includens]|uniref:Uncharacterized protein n=1 Tax=Chrysodeixis includens TaxID=689277 RepID=A0A9N8PXV9_CHRIL|nr:unnamed protein product [Chrysodeixis includens]
MRIAGGYGSAHIKIGQGLLYIQGNDADQSSSGVLGHCLPWGWRAKNVRLSRSSVVTWLTFAAHARSVILAMVAAARQPSLLRSLYPAPAPRAPAPAPPPPAAAFHPPPPPAHHAAF